MLTISRDDVSSTEITQYEDRFIKIPIEGYLSAIGISPIPPQTALINAINNPKYRFIVACLSRRVGKTYISNIIGQLILLYPGTKVLIVAPDYTLAGISWDLQRSLLNKFDVEREKDNAKDRSVILENGSEVRVASVSRIDSAVGRSYDLIIFDEAALNDKGGSAFNVALMPTLDKANSKAIFISTPRGDNWFKDFFDNGFSDEYPEWCSIHCTYEANPRISERAIAGARKTLSAAEFAQEYMAEFTVFEGQIWGMPPENIQDLTVMKHDILQNPSRYDIIAGLDIGFRDENAMCVVAVIEEKFYIIDSYMSRGVDTSTLAESISALVEKWDIDYVFIDSAAQQTRWDLAQIYDIATINAIKHKLPGIGYVGTEAEKGRLIIDEEQEEVVYSMLNYKWDMNALVEKPVHDRASHMADAIRYAMYSYGVGMGSSY